MKVTRPKKGVVSTIHKGVTFTCEKRRYLRRGQGAWVLRPIRGYEKGFASGLECLRAYTKKK